MHRKSHKQFCLPGVLKFWSVQCLGALITVLKCVNHIPGWALCTYVYILLFSDRESHFHFAFLPPPSSLLLILLLLLLLSLLLLLLFCLVDFEMSSHFVALTGLDLHV